MRISQIFVAASLAKFDVPVPVQLRYLLGRDSAAPVKAVAVLTNNIFEDPSVDELNKAHVCSGGDGRE